MTRASGVNMCQPWLLDISELEVESWNHKWIWFIAMLTEGCTTKVKKDEKIWLVGGISRILADLVGIYWRALRPTFFCWHPEHKHGNGIPPPHTWVFDLPLTQMGVIQYQMRCLWRNPASMLVVCLCDDSSHIKLRIWLACCKCTFESTSL